MVTMVRRYGWRPGLPDARNYPFERLLRAAKLPAKVDLRPQFKFPAYDQLQLGSCVGNGCTALAEFLLYKCGMTDFAPSRLFNYYAARAYEGTTGYDAGAEVKDGMKALAKLGAPHESLWPYMIKKFATKPTVKVHQDALKTILARYEKVDNTKLVAMKSALAQGYPIVGGFSVYDSFESAKVAATGVVPMPNLKKESLLGGHCILVVGYNDSTSRFIGRNSWGINWGIQGYFTIPYLYYTNPQMASDFWVGYTET